jgi:ubiquinone/menaquinone biosynthesis C-methylase UbiE
VNDFPAYIRGILIPPRRFDAKKPEMVDMPDADPVLLQGELRNLRIINRRFGGIRSVQQALIPMAAGSDPERTFTILDCATGSADQAVEIVRMLRRLGISVAVTAVDNNDTVLDNAREYASGYSEIRFENLDIRELRYPDRSFDVVLCSLALHHFSRTDAVRCIQEIDRISRIGFILHDLSRSYIAAACAWIYTRVTTTNIMTKTDAIMSVMAAFTKAELAEMIHDAGSGPVEISSAPFFRMMGIRRK